MKNNFFIFCKFIKSDLFSILFVASLVFLIHHNTSLFAPFDTIALHFNTSISHGIKSDKKNLNDNTECLYKNSFIAKELIKHTIDKKSPILLIYNQDIYNKKFHGISPLDRCVLTKDLSAILKEKPKIVAFDIDLSPLRYPSPQYEKCQKQLEKVIQNNSDKIVLLYPIYENKHIDEWLKKMKKRHIVFASPIITTSLGIALNRSSDVNSLGEIVYKKLHTEKLLHIEKKHEVSHEMPINYTEAGDFGTVKKKGSLKNKVVFVGGSYGADDTYLTPLGENVPGVMIHGYEYFSAEHPVETSGIANLLAYIADILFAIMVGYIMKKMWNFYIQKLNEQLESSYLILLSIFLVLTFFVILGIIMASFLLEFNIWISPIPIIIAIFFDGIINSLVEQSKRESKEKNCFYNKVYFDNIGYIIKVCCMLFIILDSFYLILIGFLH